MKVELNTVNGKCFEQTNIHPQTFRVQQEPTRPMTKTCLAWPAGPCHSRLRSNLHFQPGHSRIHCIGHDTVALVYIVYTCNQGRKAIQMRHYAHLPIYVLCVIVPVVAMHDTSGKTSIQSILAKAPMSINLGA